MENKFMCACFLKEASHKTQAMRLSFELILHVWLQTEENHSKLFTAAAEYFITQCRDKYRANSKFLSFPNLNL